MLDSTEKYLPLVWRATYLSYMFHSSQLIKTTKTLNSIWMLSQGYLDQDICNKHEKTKYIAFV